MAGLIRPASKLPEAAPARAGGNEKLIPGCNTRITVGFPLAMNSRCSCPPSLCHDRRCTHALGFRPGTCSAHGTAATPALFGYPRSLLGLIGVALLLALVTSSGFACEIKFGVDDRSQGPYPTGTTVIFRLRVDLTHNNCPVDLKETKIQGIGLTILGATPWQNPAPNLWERRIKVAIASAPADGKVTLSAKRSCDKDGGWGAITVASSPVNS